MRDACGDEIRISGLEELIEIAIPLQRASYTEAQWERIENPAPPSASEEEGGGCGASAQGNATENATALLGEGATPAAAPPGEAGSGPSGATPCFPGGCLSGADCSSHGDCVRGVCECDAGYLGENCSVVATCLFWDDAGNGSWSDRGCVKATAPTRRTDGFVHCRCNHLTDFGGVMIPTIPEELAEFTDVELNTFTLDQLVGPATTPPPMSKLSPSPTTAPISDP